jgi:hypothetical protein
VAAQKKTVEQLKEEGRLKSGSELPPEKKDKPVHEIRIGKIKAVIWANHTEGGVRHNVQLRRIFKRDDSAQWESSDSLGRDDCLVGAEVLRLAALWIYDHGQGG